MIAGFLLWLGLFGLVLFSTFDTPLSRKALHWWLLGSAVVGTMLWLPVLMILLAMQMVLLQ